MEKVQRNSITKNKMDLNNIKMKKSSTIPRYLYQNTIFYIIVSFYRRLFDHFDHVVSRKKKVPFSMAIGNGELMQECFPKHSGMATARMK